MYPADILRQDIKLAEVLASLPERRADSLPPPPYQEATKSAPVGAEDASDDFDDFEDALDDELAPITISLDTSITIDGTNNTVMLPVSEGARESCSCSTLAEKEELRSDSVSSKSQQYRQSRSAQLASSVIIALEQSGVLEDKESGRKRPIEININAGLRIRGERSIICTGLLKRTDGKSSPPEATQTAGRKRSSSTESDGAVQPNKRRNLSEE